MYHLNFLFIYLCKDSERLRFSLEMAFIRGNLSSGYTECREYLKGKRNPERGSLCADRTCLGCRTRKIMHCLYSTFSLYQNENENEDNGIEFLANYSECVF